MKVLKIILIIFIVIIGGSAAYFATLDGHYDVNRSTVINATPEAVYAEVSDFKTWPSWGAWFERDSTMEVTYGEIAKGKGATYAWTSEKSGEGNMTILEATPTSSMETKIEFGGMGSSSGFWVFEPAEGGTKVTWSMRGEMPFFFRFLAADMDKSVGPDFEVGLANLKKLIESRQPALEITTVTLKPQPLFYIHREIDWQDLTSDFYDANYAQINAYLAEDMDKHTGMPMSVIYEWDEINQTASMDFGIPNVSTKKGNGTILKGETPSGKMLRATHVGPNSTIIETHYAIDDYMLKNNLEINGPVMEVFLFNKEHQPDSTFFKTEIYYPIK